MVPLYSPNEKIFRETDLKSTNDVKIIGQGKKEWMGLILHKKLITAVGPFSEIAGMNGWSKTPPYKHAMVFTCGRTRVAFST